MALLSRAFIFSDYFVQKIIYLLLVIHAENISGDFSGKQNNQGNCKEGRAVSLWGTEHKGDGGRQSCSRVPSTGMCVIANRRWTLLAGRKPIAAEGAGGKKNPSENPTAGAVSSHSSEGMHVWDFVCSSMR